MLQQLVATSMVPTRLEPTPLRLQSPWEGAEFTGGFHPCHGFSPTPGRSRQRNVSTRRYCQRCNARIKSYLGVNHGESESSNQFLAPKARLTISQIRSRPRHPKHNHVTNPLPPELIHRKIAPEDPMLGVFPVSVCGRNNQFPVRSVEASGMLEVIIWTLLG